MHVMQWCNIRSMFPPPLVSINLLLWSDQSGWSLPAPGLMCEAQWDQLFDTLEHGEDVEMFSDGARWRLFMMDTRLIGSNYPPDTTKQTVSVSASQSEAGWTSFRSIITLLITSNNVKIKCFMLRLKKSKELLENPL